MAISDKQDRYLRYLTGHVLPIIREYGWMVQAVFGTEDDPGPDFAYTIGLTGAGLPELVITGFPHEMAAEILNAYARRHVRDEIRPGDEVQVAPSQVKLRAVAAPGTEAGTAFALYGDRCRFVQLLWPDDKGAYPGDAGWTYPADNQPVLTTPLAEPPTGDGVIDVIDEVARDR